MERFPRGSIPPSAFTAIATVAPNAIARPGQPEPELDPEPVVQAAQPVHKECDLSTTCPNCNTQMQPEHAHYRCGKCGYRDSCCF